MGGLIGAMIISGRAMAPVGQIAQVLGRLNISVECFKRVDKFMKVTSREEEARAYVERSELKGSISTKNLLYRLIRLPLINLLINFIISILYL